MDSGLPLFIFPICFLWFFFSCPFQKLFNQFLFIYSLLVMSSALQNFSSQPGIEPGPNIESAISTACLGQGQCSAFLQLQSASCPHAGVLPPTPCPGLASHGAEVLGRDSQGTERPGALGTAGSSPQKCLD